MFFLSLSVIENLFVCLRKKALIFIYVRSYSFFGSSGSPFDSLMLTDASSDKTWFETYDKNT